jgi:hypothetical protein
MEGVVANGTVKNQKVGNRMLTPFYPSGRPLISCARGGVFCTRPSTGKNITVIRCPGSVEFEPDQTRAGSGSRITLLPPLRTRTTPLGLSFFPPRSPLRSRLPAQRSSRHFPEGKSLLSLLGNSPYDFVRDLRERTIWGGGGLDLEVGSSARLSRAG